MSSNWEVNADLVLTVLAGEQRDGLDEHYIKALSAGFNPLHLPEGKARKLWALMEQFRRSSLPLLPGSVGAKDPSLMSYVADLLIAWGDGQSSLVGSVFEMNLAACKEHAARALALKALRQATAQLETRAALQPTLAYLDDQLKAARQGDEPMKGETARELGREFRERMTSEPPPLFTFGIEELDRWTTGGIPVGMDYVMSIAGPAKSRKTSLALNILLNALRQGRTATILMLEDNRERITAAIVCMMAIDWLNARGIADQPTRPGSPILNRNINADVLFKHGNKIFAWQDNRVKALQAAIDEYESFDGRLRIYDQTKAGGGLSRTDDLTRVMERDMLLRGKPDLVMLDHAQCLKDGDDDYKRLRIAGEWVESFARKNRLALILLAQTRSGTNDSMESAETRGGSKLDEMSDALLGVRYNHLTPNMLDMKMFEQRKHGAGMRAKIGINPDTGRILNGGRQVDRINLNEL